MESVLKKAINHYGKDKQCMVAVEELAELQKEISKFTRGKDNRDALTEEIADVYIMIDQICMMADIELADIGVVIERKVERLKERINDDIEDCSTCRYSDIECNEQCKNHCKGCFGASMNDCENCKWHGVD